MSIERRDVNHIEVELRVGRTVGILGRYAEDISFRADYTDKSVQTALRNLYELAINDIPVDVINDTVRAKLESVTGYPYDRSEFMDLVSEVVNRAYEDAHREENIDHRAELAAFGIEEHWRRSGKPRDHDFIEYEREMLEDGIIGKIGDLVKEGLNREKVLARIRGYLPEEIDLGLFDGLITEGFEEYEDRTIKPTIIRIAERLGEYLTRNADPEDRGFVVRKPELGLAIVEDIAYLFERGVSLGRVQGRIVAPLGENIHVNTSTVLDFVTRAHKEYESKQRVGAE